MRSLTLLDVVSHPIVGSSGSSSSSSSTPSTSAIDSTPTSVAAVTLDAATRTLYVVAETTTPQACSQLCVYRLENGRHSNEFPQPIISWTTDLVSPLPNIPLVVAFKYLPESDSLVLVLSNGDVEQITDSSELMGSDATRENVGTFDSGIKAAAWAPDEELLAIVTGDDLLLSMTATFDVLSEGPLTTTSFGVDAPVNVGWGDKSTQFHGSLGKSAAKQPSIPTTQTLASPNDDDRIRISWRGDSAWFSVTKFERTPTGDTRRVLRVYSRLGELSSTGEACMGMEGGLSWQPSGSLIAANQREGGQQNVVFFERNGLRRYAFALREPEAATVKELSWNSESNLLGIWLSREDGDAVQLWNRNNYCWTLKQELAPRSRITSLFWHPEEPLSLYLTTRKGIQHFCLAWDTFISSRKAPKDSGSVAVVDGTTLKLTPFRLVNIPPPMAAIVLHLGAGITKTPVHVSFAKEENGFVVLFDDGLVQSWAWELDLKTKRNKPRSEIKGPVLAWSMKVEGDGYCKQCAVVGRGEEKKVAVLRCTGTVGTEVVLLGKKGGQEVVKAEEGAWKIEGVEGGFVLESKDGMLLEVSPQATSDDILPSNHLLPLPEFCPDIRTLTLSTTRLVLGLSLSGRLYSNSRLLASDATSFICTHDFLIYTTFTHEAKFIPLFSLESGKQNDFVTHIENVRKAANDEESSGSNLVKSGGMGIRRAVERGSRIVTVVESSTTLVLQMPRGNLETICPRPLVLRIVRHELDRCHYRTAFLTCRRHRIDLNILYDHKPSTFRAQLSDFVTQVKEVDYLNLFLSGLKDEDVTKTMYKPLMILGPTPSTWTALAVEGDESDVIEGKVNEVCDLVREELEKRDVFEYANSVLTAYVRKKPADYESALRVLVDLKAKDSERAQDAVKYIIFLSDANKLYDLALGMYDFGLVLLIAQESQKDPREYLPFLRELRQLDTYLQRHRIDDHLERYDSALRNLAKAGEERFDEVLEYTKKHGLFKTALEAYKADSARYKVVVEANADYLMENRKYAEAGLLYSIASQPTKAMAAYQSANAWQELFTIALSPASPEMPKKPASEIKALAVEVAEALRGKRRFSEAGRVLLEYGRDIEAAVHVLVEGNEFAECLRISTLYNRRDLIETHVKASTLEAQSKLIDDFGELKEQIEKQVERLDELKKRRDANPNQFFCIDDPSAGPDDIDVQPDGESDAGTAFTRYTAAAPTTLGGGSRISSTRSSRSRRRAGLKKAAGKKGSIYEETYLLNSFKKSVETRLAELQTETGALLSALLLLHSTNHRSAAAALQAELTSLEEFLRASLDHVWSWREKEWATEKHEEVRLKERGEWVEKPKPEEGTEKVESPKMAREKWKIGLLDVL